jgi:2,4-dienoyl-CoA reductase-like NADH-dependent reductase (Old Yellow Enzyme family)
MTIDQRAKPESISNYLVRSAIRDPSILTVRQMMEDVLDFYRNQALGGVGIIITGGFQVKCDF